VHSDSIARQTYSIYPIGAEAAVGYRYSCRILPIAREQLIGYALSQYPCSTSIGTAVTGLLECQIGVTGADMITTDSRMITAVLSLVAAYKIQTMWSDICSCRKLQLLESRANVGDAGVS
jgi:hypothetical protein